MLNDMREVFIMAIRTFVITMFLCLTFNSGIASAGTFATLFKKVSPSVVVINSKGTVVSEKGQTATVGGLGTGVLVSKDGYVMTAAHVVHAADSLVVSFQGGEEISATVVASEPAADVALLKLDKMPKNASVAIIGDSDDVKIGDEVFIIGTPYGLSHTLTVGHISARHEPYSLPGEMALAEFFQTDAAVNQGNSGGPMFNMKGEVIGIVSHIISKSGGFEGIGFAATTKTANEFLLEKKTFWAGITGYVLYGDLARIFNVPQETAILIQHVANGSPAQKLGLKGGSVQAQIGDSKLIVGGDILLSINGISLDKSGSYLKAKEAISSLSDNSYVTVIVLRNGSSINLTAPIGKLYK